MNGIGRVKKEGRSGSEDRGKEWGGLNWTIEVILSSNGDVDDVCEYHHNSIHGNGRDVVSVREFE